MHNFTYRLSMNKFGVALLLILLALFGCKKENTDFPPPSIELVSGSSFVSNDTILKIGDAFKIGIIANNPKINLTNFIIKVETQDMEVFLDSGMNSPQLHYEKTFIKGIDNIEKWNFIIRDRDGKSSEVSLSLHKDTSSSFGNINYYDNITLGGQNSEIASFFSLEHNASFILSDAFLNQEKIDLCYYYDFIDTDESTIASPGANIDGLVYPGEYGLNNWNTRRTSRFKVVNISKEDFLNATNDSLLIAAHGQSDGNRKAKNLQTGKLFAFKNENGKIGIFIVNNITGTDEGSINISIKVQE